MEKININEFFTRKPYFTPTFEKDSINEFFKYISRDTTGKIGRDYIHFNNSLQKLITMLPKQITLLYTTYLNTININEMSKEEKNSYQFLTYDKPLVLDSKKIKQIEKSFLDILNASKEKSTDDNRTPEFLFALNLWLFIWH
tara:strand:- start:1360 stop:1785 length:426 start_codon:yes stop_codon:yes gene_type:complete